MKKCYSISLVALALLSASAYANVCSIVHGTEHDNYFDGVTECGQGMVLQPTTVHGSLTLNGTSIASDFIVYGTFTGDHVAMSSGKLMIRGPMQITHSTLQSLELYGPLRATSSELVQDVTIYGDTVVLNQTTAQGFTIKNSGNKKVMPKVSLDNHSSVEGDITFVGNPGVVLLDKTSTFKGRVINGSRSDGNQ